MSSTSSSSSNSSSVSSSASSSSASAAGFGIAVQGNKLVDLSGATVQLRGVNYSGFESVAIQGWSPADPSGGFDGHANGPSLAAILSWGANAIRIPMNEDSWLGLSCYEANGNHKSADPGNNYQSAIKNLVQAANAAGLYVILDLHWSAPNWPSNYSGSSISVSGTPPVCAEGQSQLPDADHSLAFWTSIATTFKGNRGVLFELFNEPFITLQQDRPTDDEEWLKTMQGGSLSIFESQTFNGPTITVTSTWQAVGMQQMLDAVRNAGARNVVLVGAKGYSGDLSKWLAFKPSDSQGQMAAVWHPYPPEGKFTAVSVAAAGTGYKVGDTITMPKPSGVYASAIVQVSSVSGSGQITGVTLPDGGDYLNTAAPSSTVATAQRSTSGSGTGATFYLQGWWGITNQWPVPANWPAVQTIAAQFPVIITEVGEHNETGATSAPWLQQLLPWADSAGISYLGWTWDLWPQSSNILIKDANATPTDGFGVYFKSHLLCRKSGAASCP